MRLTITILTALLLLGACHQSHYIHPDFQQYVDKFIQEATQHGRTDLPTDSLVLDYFEKSGWHKAGSPARGVTVVDQHFIYVEKLVWDALSPVCKEITIYHELGHVWLDRAHVANSIMQGDVSPCSLIQATPSLRPGYINELFTVTTPKRGCW